MKLFLKENCFISKISNKIEHDENYNSYSFNKLAKIMFNYEHRKHNFIRDIKYDLIVKKQQRKFWPLQSQQI